MNSFYITTPIYYVNDRGHVGHAYTTIACDILARFNKLQGKNVSFTSGADENSLKNVQAAEKAGMPVQDWLDEYALETKAKPV